MVLVGEEWPWAYVRTPSLDGSKVMDVLPYG